MKNYVTKLNVKTVFLRGDVKETIYILEPEGFIKKGK